MLNDWGIQWVKVIARERMKSEEETYEIYTNGTDVSVGPRVILH